MNAPELVAKIKRQRKALRQMNKALEGNSRMQQLLVRRVVDLSAQLRESQRRVVDYRSVCQCWACRVREWYRFRSGETYPGKVGWRLPWSGYWPYWR